VRIEIILVPYDTARRGWRCGAGPEHLVRAGLRARLERAGHEVAGTRVIEADPAAPAAEIATGFELIQGVAQAVRAAREAGRFPVILSGNCNLAVGTLSGLTPAPRAVFWFDAHGDLNTPETTTSGFLDGTGLATALGLCWRGLTGKVPGFRPVESQTTFLLGVRDLDPAESALLSGAGITALSAAQLPEELPGALDRVPVDDALGYLHVDLDVLDPDLVGRANLLPVAGGLSAEALLASIVAIRRRVELGALAIASYAPEYDTDGAVCEAAFAALEVTLGQAAR
jgi:arginase